MKKVLSLIVALIMVLSLTACSGNSASESESSAPTSSTEEPESSSTAEESEPEEEIEEEEPVDVDVQMTDGDNSVSVVVDGQTMATFTLPAGSPMFPKITHNEDSLYAMIIHPVMEGVSGRTIVEAAEDTSEDYMDYAKGIVGMDETVQPETKDLNGKEVLVCKWTEQVTNDFDKEVINFKYVVAVPVAENVTLGFRINGSYDVDNELVFDDSLIDLLLSNCAF